MDPTERESNVPDRTLESENYIDHLCDEFENHWRSGVQPDLQAFLARVSLDQRSWLFAELLPLDWEYRAANGDTDFLDTYLPQFSEFAAAIEALNTERRLQETVANQHSTLEQPAFKGMSVSHFQLTERLGAGAVGEVWKATDVLLQRLVAIKFPRRVRLNEGELLRFRREGKAAAQLQHPGIVGVHEVGQQADLIYIVSDYIDGQDLRHWLANHTPSSQQAAEICAQLAEALYHAHQRGIVHRDLKPANVLLDRQGRPRITDFGLAKWDEDDSSVTVEGDLLGTPAYMSPEQARGEAANSDHRSDIYSLGVLLYEMLTGRCPFAGDHVSILHHVIHELPPAPRAIQSDIPRDLETICLKALEKRPQDRYPSAQEMAVDLLRFLRGDSIYARRASVLERFLRWIRRHPGAVAAGAFALAAVIATIMTVNYARRIRVLRGLRHVVLTTEPTGADVTLVPLNASNGNPDVDKILQPGSHTPLEIELPPGEYLTIVVLEGGRFHEVLRRIPNIGEDLPGAFNHNSWTIDDQGSIVLPTITIPSLGVKQGMALINSGDRDEEALTSSSSRDSILGSVPAFYVDTTEVTVDEFRRVRHQGNTDRRSKRVPADWAITVNYDDAVRFAEKIGKRLPTEIELIYVREIGSRNEPTISNGSQDRRFSVDLGPVGTPITDRYDFDRPVFGIRSNVAEWTMSWPAFSRISEHDPRVAFPFMRDHRIICCAGSAALREEGLNVKSSLQVPFSVPVGRVSGGLGFRCVRSVRPRTSPEDFGDAVIKRQPLTSVE